MIYPKLYKLTSTKKIQEWEIFTEENKIIVIQGQIKGKKQRYEETIKEGKNIGKENETTTNQQADAVAKSKWEKKHNKDYHSNIKDCKQGTKIANLGGYLPMLAQTYQKHADKHLKYPCYIQPKLDGLRCIATKNDGEVGLWFRSGKKITTMEHIVNDLNLVMKEGDIFDGELYVHNEDFNSFTGAIRASKNLKPEIIEKIQYHIYDFPRINNLTEEISYEKRKIEFQQLKIDNSLVPVSTVRVSDFDDAYRYYKIFIEIAYEGIMFRNIDMPYEQKRSYSLLKYKEFVEDEFIITGAEEGKGSLAGHVGAFVCKIEPNRLLKDIGGRTFTFGNEEGVIKAKLMGKREYLKHLYESPKEYLNKSLTIKYQNLSQDGIPRFPVAKAIRFDK